MGQTTHYEIGHPTPSSGQSSIIDLSSNEQQTRQETSAMQAQIDKIAKDNQELRHDIQDVTAQLNNMQTTTQEQLQLMETSSELQQADVSTSLKSIQETQQMILDSLSGQTANRPSKESINQPMTTATESPSHQGNQLRREQPLKPTAIRASTTPITNPYVKYGGIIGVTTASSKKQAIETSAINMECDNEQERLDALTEKGRLDALTKQYDRRIDNPTVENELRRRGPSSTPSAGSK